MSGTYGGGLAYSGVTLKWYTAFQSGQAYVYWSPIIILEVSLCICNSREAVSHLNVTVFVMQTFLLQGRSLAMSLHKIMIKSIAVS